MTKDEKVLEALRLTSTASDRWGGWVTSEEVDEHGSEVGLEVDNIGRTVHITDLERLHSQEQAERRFVRSGLMPYKWRETLWQFRPVH